MEKSNNDNNTHLLGMTTKKDENSHAWYSEILMKAELIDYYDISGCYILRPNSYRMWELLKEELDNKLKTIGVENCYFPLFVTEKALGTEKDHLEGFSPEVAWVTKAG